MDIVVNDTNILIDLFNAGLLEHCKKLDLDFRTLDVIMFEVTDSQQLASLNKIIQDNTLKVETLDAAQMEKVFEKIADYQGKCNLSPQDIAVMVYAKDNNCRLLTGDKTLRQKASAENIVVSGIFYLTDLFMEKNIINPTEMRHALEKLKMSNERLPKKLINDRLDRLSIPNKA